MIRPDKQPIRVYLFRNGNLSPGTKFYRLDEGRKFKVIVYIFLEYVIGCSIDLLYTGLNFAPYFQKECTYVIVASSSYMLWLQSAYNNKFWMGYYYSCDDLSKIVGCLQVFRMFYTCVYIVRYSLGLTSGDAPWRNSCDGQSLAHRPQCVADGF